MKENVKGKSKTVWLDLSFLLSPEIKKYPGSYCSFLKIHDKETATAFPPCIGPLGFQGASITPFSMKLTRNVLLGQLLFGLYELRRLPHGLCNAPGSTMRRMITFSDLVTFAPSEEELERLSTNGLDPAAKNWVQVHLTHVFLQYM